MIETVRVSAHAKDQLTTLKRRTGITQWNILCRWALLRSIAEPSVPARVEIAIDSNVEMTWRVFAGSQQELLLALLRQRCVEDGLEPDDGVVGEQFRLHLHRGIGYLFGDKSLQRIDDLVQLAV